MVQDGASEVFQAQHILVKCPSKYNEAGEFEEGGYEAAEPGLPVTQTSAPLIPAPPTPAASGSGR